MFKVLSLCLLGYFVAICNGGPTASFITPCKPADEACLMSSAKAALPHLADGVPSLGVDPVDPLILDDVKYHEEGLQLQFNHMKVAGFRNCKFSKISLTDDISSLNLAIECPIRATGLYKVSGKLIFVPIEGEGDFEIKTEKILISLKVHLERDEHWYIESVEHTYEPEEQIYFRLDNLFGGDEEKAKPVSDMLNYSWKEVIRTIGKPIIQEIVNKAKDHVNGFLTAVPIEELVIV